MAAMTPLEAPMDRSISPRKSTKVTPRARMPVTTVCRARLVRLLLLRNSGSRQKKKSQISSRTMPTAARRNSAPSPSFSRSRSDGTCSVWLAVTGGDSDAHDGVPPPSKFRAPVIAETRSSVL